MPASLQVDIMKTSRPVRDLTLCADASTETLIGIAKLPNRNMVRRLLDRPDLPLEVYEVLITREPSIRFAVAGHSKTPPEILERLADNDDDPLVREAALLNRPR